MTQDILIAPGSGEPYIKFIASGVNDTVSAVNLNIISGVSPVSGINAAGSGVTTLSFEGTQGQLFSITDNLSSGTIFSVSDIVGLPLIEVDASGDVKIGEFGRNVGIGSGVLPAYQLDVFGTGNFHQGVLTPAISYTDGDASMTVADGGKVTFSAGFAVGSDAEGDMLYHNGTTYVRLAKGTDDYVLTMNGNVPNWESAGGGGGGSMTTVKSNGSQVGGADIVTLDFSSRFSISEDPDTEINIELATVPVDKGGTNATSFADKAVIISQDSGDDTLAALALSTNGKLVIGGTSGPAAADLASAGNSIAFTTSDGGLNLETVGGGPPSDERLKTNVTQLQYSGLETIQQLNPVEFDWNNLAFDSFPHQMLERHDIGLIAQEVEGVVPEIIGSRKEFKTVDYAKLVVILTKAVQELKQEVDELTEEVGRLKKD